MKRSLSVTELVRNFADYVNQVAYRGERFRLTRGGKPVAELGPVAIGRSLTDLPDLVAGLPSLSDDEAADFSADLDRARTELERIAPEDPWTS
jgi:prevent-host-death family protein